MLCDSRHPSQAMAWSLHPQKALRELPSWQDVESAQIDPDNILVLCGPAHVQEPDVDLD